MTPAHIERIEPHDREAWLRIRNRDVTASVVGALFGAHEFVSLYELWAMKTGRLKRSTEETPAMARGRLLEPVAVQLLREQFPMWKIDHNAAGVGIYFRDPDKRLGGTPDVIAIDPKRPGRGVVQIKSVEATIFRKKWFVDGEIEAPLWIALQATLEAYLTGSSWAVVAPLVVGHGVDLHPVEIPLVDGVIDAMAAKAAEFFQMIAEGREPTPDFERDAGVIDRLYAEADEDAEVDLSADNRVPELMEARALAQAAIAESKAEVERIDAEVKSKMGEAVIAHIGGGRRITWKTIHKAGAFVAPSSFRALRYPTVRK